MSPGNSGVIPIRRAAMAQKFQPWKNQYIPCGLDGWKKLKPRDLRIRK
jgi:hypothetical protein